MAAGTESGPDGCADPQVPLRWLHALAEVARAVNVSTPLPDLLDLVTDVVCRLTGYGFAAVFQPDGDGRRLVVGGAAGFSPRYRERVNREHPGPLLPDGGPAALAFSDRRAVIVPDITAEPTFAPWVGVAREQGYRSVACVPLLAREPVGVLACYTSAPHDFSARELALLSTLAEQSVVAIESAALRQRQRDTIALLERAEDLHHQLMEVLFRDAGLDSLAHALARMLSGPVLICDGAGSVLAAGGLPSGVPPAPPPLPEGHGDRLIDVTGDAGRRWLCAPVMRGGEPLARLWAFRDGEVMGALERRVLDNGALAVTLEILRRRTAQETAWRLSGDLLADMLEEPGPDPAVADERAAHLHHDLTVPHAVLVARADPVGSVEAVLGLVRRLTRTDPPRPLVGRRGEDVVILWPSGDDGRPAADRLAETLRRAAHRDLRGTTVSVAVGRGTASRTEVAAAARVTRRALELSVRRGGRDRVVTLADTGVERLLLQVTRPEELIDFVQDVLGPVVAYDRSRGGQLLATLRAYLDADCHTVAAAQRLTVHPNTVAYRLRRIAELCGRDLARTEAVIEVGLALRVSDLGPDS